MDCKSSGFHEINTKSSASVLEDSSNMLVFASAVGGVGYVRSS